MPRHYDGNTVNTSAACTAARHHSSTAKQRQHGDTASWEPHGGRKAASQHEDWQHLNSRAARQHGSTRAASGQHEVSTATRGQHGSTRSALHHGSVAERCSRVIIILINNMRCRVGIENKTLRGQARSFRQRRQVKYILRENEKYTGGAMSLVSTRSVTAVAVVKVVCRKVGSLWAACWGVTTMSPTLSNIITLHHTLYLGGVDHTPPHAWQGWADHTPPHATHGWADQSQPDG